MKNKIIIFLLLLAPLASLAQTWTPVGPLGFSPGSAWWSSIAIDPGGTPYVIYEDLVNGNKATVMKFNGSSWISVGLPDFSPGGVVYTCIAIDRNGTPYAAFQDNAYGNKVSVMKFNGVSWQYVGVPGFSGGAGWFVALALDSSGNPWVAYETVGTGAASVMKFNGSAWVTVGASSFSAGSGQWFSMVIDNANTPYVSYVDYAYGLRATVMKFDGTAWVNVGSPGFSRGNAENSTSLALDSAGTPYVVYSDSSYGGKVTVMKFNGSSWVYVGSPGFSDGMGQYATIDIDCKGTPFVVYQDAGNGYRATAKKFNSTDWETVGGSGFTPGQVWWTDIAIDRSGTPYMVFATNGLLMQAAVMKLPVSALTIVGPDSLCPGAAITLADSTPGGIWSSSGPAATIGSVTGVVTGIGPGTAFIYYSTGTSCIGSKTITVDAVPAVPGPITSNLINAFCVGKMIVVQDAPTGGTWSLSNSHISRSGDTLTAISPGTDTIYYTISNACGTATVADSFSVPAAIPLPQGNLAICVGDTGVIFDSVWGGTWYGGGPDLHIATTFYDSSIIIGGISAGFVPITYGLDLGCSATATVTINPLPAVGPISGPDPVCVGAIFRLFDSVTGGTWISNSTVIATISGLAGGYEAVALGTTVITYATPVNSAGCRNQAVFNLSVVQNPFPITGDIADILCYGGRNGSLGVLISSGYPPFQYLWSDGSTSPSITGLAPGSYSVRVTQVATQCTVNDTFTITQPDSAMLTPQVTNDACHNARGSISVSVTGGSKPYTYLWSDNTSISDRSYLSAGNYALSVTDAHGCVAGIAVTVIDSACMPLVIHDGISPNGDGINDVWVIEHIQEYPGNSIKVFDKFGDLVFERSDYDNDWNGAGKNGPLPDGTYYYLVKLNSANAPAKENFTGSLLIKR